MNVLSNALSIFSSRFALWGDLSVGTAASRSDCQDNLEPAGTAEEGRLFEQEFAKLAGCKHGVRIASGTVALDRCGVVAGAGRDLVKHDQRSA